MAVQYLLVLFLSLKGKMMEMIKRFVKEEEGLETVEYAIIAGLIVVGVILSVTAIGGYVAAKFTALETALAPAP